MRSTRCRSTRGLQALIDTDPKVCTSLLIDRLLHGRCRAWALVGAYGDNLTAVADALAAQAGIGAAQRAQLRRARRGHQLQRLR
jgi:hypothetical protein